MFYYFEFIKELIMLNEVLIIGNTGDNPNIQVASNGKEYARLSVATNEYRYDKTIGEPVNKAQWHNIVTFNAALVSYIKNNIKKGSKVFIKGNLQYISYKDENNNEEKNITQIKITAIFLLDSKSVINELSEKPIINR